MRSRYKIVLEGGLYFITSTIVEWIPVFTSEPYFQIIIEALKYSQQEKGLKLYAYPVRRGYVEQPEHWKYSSARNYILEDDSIIKMDSVRGEQPSAS